MVLCGALSSCTIFGGGESSSAPPRCGRSYVTPVYWGASAGAGAIGGWYGGAYVDDGAYYSGWYDPGDDYDPASNSGGISADPNSNDGSGWDQPDDGSGDPGTGDTSGDSAGDSSGQAFTRLHLHEVTASPRPPAPSPSSTLAPGCFACTMGCRTDAAPPASGRQAVGLSDTSIDDACSSAVRTLAQWSHDTHRARLLGCQRIDGPNPPSPSRQ